MVLFDIIEFSFDIFLRLLEPGATARARLDKKKLALNEKLRVDSAGHLTFFYDTDLLSECIQQTCICYIWLCC